MNMLNFARLWRALLCVWLVWGGSVVWAASQDIILAVEEPINGSIYTGVSNIRGFALSPFGISRVELYIDEQLRANIPIGGSRGDVGDAFPDIPNSRNSGFSMAFNYSNLTRGAHTIRIRAVESTGAVRDVTVPFSVARFDNSFVQNPASVTLNGASCAIVGETILLNNVSVEGKRYNVDMSWRTATQDFALTSIDGGGGPSLQAQWGASNAICCTDGSSTTFALTIDGVTRRSTLSSCQANPTFEGFVTAASGAKTATGVLTAGCAPQPFNFTFNTSLEANQCHLFTVDLNEARTEFILKTSKAADCNQLTPQTGQTTHRFLLETPGLMDNSLLRSR